MRSPLAVGALALGLLASGALLAVPPAAAAPKQPRVTESSAVTKSGTGEFADLKVTVSQTKNLVNQVVRVYWEGGKPTKPEFGLLGVNYLQIMQCWGGTAEDGPPREQCVYGTQKTGNGGQNTNSRQMSTGSTIDPLEDKYDDYLFSDLSYIPFVSWTGKTSTGPKSEFFDRYTSNESNHNRTRADGTGEDFFEVQSGVESPGLGCGQSRDGESPLCWLVVVPRGETEVDGTKRGLTYTEGLNTSPLMASNWKNRIVFPLEFQPVGAACTIGGSETPLLGTDRVVEAVSRWQPAWCADDLGNFSYTVLSDLEAREKLKTETPTMAFLGYGVPEAEAPRDIVYAPVALSGLTVAFNVESQSSTLAPEAVRLRDGQRLKDIKITPRLMAKLLTQSYRFDAVPVPDKVEKNPFDLAQDPDFLELNPQFKDLRFPGLGHVVTTLGETDSARLVWDWIWSDPEAREWVKGKPDKWGMVINPAYKRQSYPRSDYPRTDNSCITYSDRTVAVCTFDLFPYAGDLYAASRAASRGDTLATGAYDPAALPPGYKKSPPQEPGRRAMVVISDSPLSARFSLTPALLRNAAGEFVGPSTEAIRAAAAKAKPTGVPGVVQPDPADKVTGAYPLTSFTYAAAVPGVLTDELAATYSAALAYVAGPGQVLGDDAGQLPVGYAPLTEAERAKLTAAAAALIERAGEDAKPQPEPEPDPDAGGGSGGGGIPTDTSGTDSSFPDTSYVDTTVVDNSSVEGTEEVMVDGTATDDTSTAGTVDTSAVDDTLVAASAATTALTPESPIGAIRYLAVLLLIAGGTALLTAAILMQRARATQTPAATPRRAPQERGAQ
ncbi:MAG: hypothetical protein B7C55_10030 [Actinomycetales bacterium mxb001]|nr:MAG: hypothetical protein B7C55_10030 [Actinomycetales bacterium mxb001]